VDALTHLLRHFALLELRLARQVALLRATGRFTEDPFRGLYVAETEVDAALSEVAPAGPWQARAAALDAVIAGRRAALASLDADLPIGHLARSFALGEVEVLALVAAAASAFDSRYAVLFAYAQNDASRRQPGAALILDLLAPEPAARAAALAAFAPDAPLRGFHLIAPSTEANPAACPLVPDSEILAYLCGGPAPCFAALAFEPAGPAPALAAFAAAEASLARQLAEHAGRPMLALLGGPADSGQRQLAARAAPLAVLQPDHPAAQSLDDETLAALTARALRLADRAVFVAPPDGFSGARVGRLVARAARPGRPVFVAGEHALPQPCGAALAEVNLMRLDEPERRAWWHLALDRATAETLARVTRLGPDGIAAGVARARRVLPEWPDVTPFAIAAAARQQAGGTLVRLAKPVETMWAWDDLVLPAELRDELEILTAAVRHGSRVATDWGFFRHAQARALVALFSGPSGTGKTMTAGLIAARADLPLYRVDLSAVVSKFIGETEKHLDAVLREAEATGAALLFDEADALFGKRAQVKDARDRYANQEIAFLLQRIEAFDGLVILTTNLSGHIDEAFLRRIAYVVNFPMPDERLRVELWQRAFPAAAPVAADLDHAALARGFELSGGNIRNAALGAAHLAAAEGREIAMRDAVRAAFRELRKLGRLPSRGQLGALVGAAAS
jgi:hypothetical protein